MASLETSRTTESNELKMPAATEAHAGPCLAANWKHRGELDFQRDTVVGFKLPQQEGYRGMVPKAVNLDRSAEKLFIQTFNGAIFEVSLPAAGARSGFVYPDPFNFIGGLLSSGDLHLDKGMVACVSENKSMYVSPYRKGLTPLERRPYAFFIKPGVVIRASKFHPSGEGIAVSLQNSENEKLRGEVVLYRFDTGAPEKLDAARPPTVAASAKGLACVFCLAIEPKGNLLAAAGEGGKVTLIDCSGALNKNNAELPVVGTFQLPTSADVTSIAISANGTMVATGQMDGSFNVLTLNTTAKCSEGSGSEFDMKLKFSDRFASVVSGVAINADCSLVAASDGESNLKVVQLAEAAEPVVLSSLSSSPGSPCSVLFFSPDSTRLVQGRCGGAVQVWGA